MIIALNMTDIADKEGVSIDIKAISKKLNTSVIPISCREGKNIDFLKKEIADLIELNSSNSDGYYYGFNSIEKIKNAGFRA